MKNNFTSQEILIVINTKWGNQEYIKRETEKETPHTQAENLAEACWNGLLGERLPEISIRKNRKSLPLWELNEGNKIFYLKLGEYDAQPDREYTINPYILAAGYHYN